MKKNQTKGDACLNCEQELTGENYCPNCGQLNNISKPTFGQLVQETMANLFAFDSKFYLSIWPLIRYPGLLSKEIMEGKRARFLPPVRLFLLIMIIALGLYSLSSRFSRAWDDVEHLRKDTTPNLAINADSTEADDLQISFGNSESADEYRRMYNFILTHPEKSVAEGMTELDIPSTFWNKQFYTNILKINLMEGTQYENFLLSNAIIILLLFVPILAFLLKLVYIRHKNYYFVDHVIFSLHTLTVFFICIILAFLLDLVIPDGVDGLIFIAFLIHLFFAIKLFYQQNVIKTLVKYFIINISFLIVSVIFILLVLLVSFILI